MHNVKCEEIKQPLRVQTFKTLGSRPFSTMKIYKENRPRGFTGTINTNHMVIINLY